MSIDLVIWGIASTVIGGALGVASALSGKQRSPYQAAIKITEEPFTSVVSLPVKEGKGKLAELIDEQDALNETNHILCQVIEANRDIPAKIEFDEATNSFHTSQATLGEVSEITLQECFLELKDFNKQLAATTTLATLAGKIITAEGRNGSWKVLSSAPERSARAVLYSIPQFFDDYSEKEQKLIRRALIGETDFVDSNAKEQQLSAWVKVVRDWSGGRS